ncbi:MAG: OmpA family protein [Chlorobi bacterium]|nr:MAG: OmpA/MotB domain protein [Chlorobi bacterium OLB7]MBK8911625.1 OmpA family protein [Chlorobiota bacterium]MBX7215685.1 OmpA family protein [Candidatus Kapabacteria bacterium]
MTLHARRKAAPMFFATMLLVAVFGAAVPPLAAQSPERLPVEINSPRSELVPVIAPDGKGLWFVRKDAPENIGGSGFDIWHATLGSNGRWNQARNVGAPLNSIGDNYVCSVTPDGQTLLLGGRYSANGEVSAGVSIARRTAEGWGKPRALNIHDFYNTARFAEYSLANDGRTLLLCLQRDDSYGDKDIYVSFWQKDGSWSRPLNLGRELNSKGSEVSPFLAADGVTLYFSTDGRGGSGDNDIFVARRLDSTWTRWTTPENLGPAINTSGFDAYYTIPASGDFAYFVSTHNESNREDIYRVPLPKPVRPKPVVLVKGKVLNSQTKEPIGARIRYERLADGKVEGYADSDPATGAYAIVLPAEAAYGFRAEAGGFIATSDNLDARTVTEYRELTRDLLLAPIQVGQTIRLNNIFFDFGSDTLRPESFPELQRIATLLRDNPRMVIQIAGHTDNIGSDQSNLRLSQNRATAVMEYLVQQGFPRNQIGAHGYGRSRPIATNDTEEGRSQNRRVEFTILGEK